MDLARNRLLQFVVVGAILYALSPRGASPELSITGPQLEALSRAEARRLGVSALSPEQRSEVVARLVDDELLLREGLRLGLDRDDAVVRARVIQKVLFYAEDAAGAAAPITDAEIEAAWTHDPTRCRAPATLDWEHVFVAGADDAARDRAKAWLSRLRTEVGADPAVLGDAFALPRKAVGATSKEVADRYGDEVAAATLTLPIGAWSEPLSSQYGLHLVRVNGRVPGERRPLASCAAELRAALSAERKQMAIRALLVRLRKETKVVVDGSPSAIPSTTAERVAMQGIE